MGIVAPVQADPHSNARNKDMRRAAKVTSSVLILALMAVAILAVRHDHGELLTESNLAEMRKVKRQNAKPPVVVKKAVATYGVQNLSKLIQTQVKRVFWFHRVSRQIASDSAARLPF